MTSTEERFRLPAARFLSPADRGASVLTLESALTERDAMDKFRRRDAAWTKRLRRIRLRSISHVFVPYYLFRVTIATANHRQTALFAEDAVRGTLDPYQFDGGLDTLRLKSIHIRNCLPVALEIDAAWPILADKLRRLVFQAGFWRNRQPHFNTEGEPLTIHVPYWVGFYEDGQFVRLEVLDAVRRCFEGAKARELFESCLADSDAPVAPIDRAG